MHIVQHTATLNKRQRRTRVAGRRLDQHVALLEAAIALGLLDHALANAVLDGAARVEELAFGICAARACACMHA